VVCFVRKSFHAWRWSFIFWAAPLVWLAQGDIAWEAVTGCIRVLKEYIPT
jgi:hypothetical protein